MITEHCWGTALDTNEWELVSIVRDNRYCMTHRWSLKRYLTGSNLLDYRFYSLSLSAKDRVNLMQLRCTRVWTLCEVAVLWTCWPCFAWLYALDMCGLGFTWPCRLFELVLCVVVVAVLLFCVILVVLGGGVVTSCSLGEFPFCVRGVCRAIFMRLFPWWKLSFSN